jgi:hypothetical protein
MSVEHWWNDADRGTGRETGLSATLPSKNLTWTDLESNPGPRCETPGANRLSHGTAFED